MNFIEQSHLKLQIDIPYQCFVYLNMQLRIACLSYSDPSVANILDWGYSLIFKILFTTLSHLPLR